MFLKRLQDYVQDEKIFTPGEKILVGLSGGPDSLCLLHALIELGLQPAAAHYDHQIRADSGSDAIRVRELAETMAVPFFSERGDVPGAAGVMHLPVESAARVLRYRFLFETARKIGAQTVAVGHTADDQVETVLLHILRGSGGDGLAGMRPVSLSHEWDERIALVRPLLSTWRSEVLTYCQENHLNPLFDPSNADTAYTRNRVRHELIPMLETYNPEIRRAIWRLAEIHAGEREMVEERIDEVARLSELRKVGEEVCLKRDILCKQPISVQRGLVRRALGLLFSGYREIDFAAIERVRGYASQSQKAGQADLMAGMAISLSTNGEELRIGPWDSYGERIHYPQFSAEEKLSLEPDLPARLQNGWLMRMDLVHGNGLYQQARANTDPFRAWMDTDAVQPPLEVRARRPGDWIMPLGMGSQHVKLSDLMINTHLPEVVREAWPIVCKPDGEVLWVPGIRLGNSVRLHPECSSAWLLSLTREQGAA